MLVLSRRKNERIKVGDVWITVVRVGSDVVRIGIDAPPEVIVLRGELVEESVVSGPLSVATDNRQRTTDQQKLQTRNNARQL